MRILLVEDDQTLSAQVRSSLSASGYVVDATANGREAFYLGTEENFDLVVLDLGLPEMDGLTVLRRWRAGGRNMPVLVLTARDAWHDKVAGIDAGADDYLAKPFHMEELLARVRALIRRSNGLASAEITCGPVVLDSRTGRVTANACAVVLTSHEFRLLAYLMHRADQIVSRTELVEHLYAQDFDRDSNTVEVFVARLRKKMPPGFIETVRGLGYRVVCVETDHPGPT